MQKYIATIVWALLCAVAAYYAFGIDLAIAQTTTPPQADRCTNDPVYAISNPYIVSNLVDSVQVMMENVGTALYYAVVGNPVFQGAVRAALTLFIIVYGILLVFGLTTVTMYEFLIRAFKFAIVVALISPGSWNFFYSLVGGFFYDGVNDLIGVMNAIAVGMSPDANSNPFAPIDYALSLLLSTRFIAFFMGLMGTGPYGWIYMTLIGIAVFTFARTLLQAMWIYLMSLVVRIFLFAIAPIFFSFLLFQRTKNLFDGWLNALISASLQPIFLFAFFAFFVRLIVGSLEKMTQKVVCWGPAGDAVKGLPFDNKWWFFAKMEEGSWIIDKNPNYSFMDQFPVAITDVLIFVLLTQLCMHFNTIVANLARDIAGASVNLNAGGALAEMLNPGRAMNAIKNSANTDAAGKTTIAGDSAVGKMLSGIRNAMSGGRTGPK